METQMKTNHLRKKRRGNCVKFIILSTRLPRRHKIILHNNVRPLLDLTELSSALKAGDDISAIKEMCTGKVVPLEGMPELWKVCYATVSRNITY